MKTLGILVTTDRHIPSVLHLARSAWAQTVAVQIHLSGLAVRIAGTPVLGALLSLADVTICRGDAEKFLPVDLCPDSVSGLFVAPEHMALVISACQRCVIL